MTYPFFQSHIRKSSGFTLLELIVVIAIVGLFSALVLVSVTEVRKKARDTKRMQDISQIQRALELYYDQYGVYPTPDFDGCGGWDVGNRDLPLLNTRLDEFMPNTPEDPYYSGNCIGYRYYRYEAGTGDCDPKKGAFYVLGITNFEASDLSAVSSPGWSCPLRNWQGEYAWVTGRFEKP